LLLSTFVLGFWYGAKLVREGKANPGDVMTVFWAALLAATYLQMVVEQLVVVTKGKTSMASLRTIIRDLPRRPTSGNPFSQPTTPSNPTFGTKTRPTSMRQIRPARCHGEYNFQNVSFYYPSRPEQWVLRDVTLFLPPGETTFIVGGSGSGKSTVVQLLLRLYTPVGGEITLDDQSIAYLDEEYTKENIAAVQQGCILFDMSVHDNVAMGLAGAGVDIKTGIKRRPRDVTRGEVEEACKMAMIHDFISGLPDGYETVLGNGGSSLSGGQRQRLAIARARIRDPTILVLGMVSFLRLETIADH
jgi:ATP-binding cassette subfamily B (MDR/TAP) protein 1